MSFSDDPGLRRVITTAATAEVSGRRPAICGTVVLHCLDHGEQLRLALSMMDALLLLNSLREIETEFELGEWTARLAVANPTAASDQIAVLDRIGRTPGEAGIDGQLCEEADEESEPAWPSTVPPLIN